MSSKITFLNDQWFWPIIGGAIILLCVFLWKELITPQPKRLYLKIILSLLAISALALIALKPAVPGNETSGKIVLLTQGYEREHLDSLKGENRQIKVLKYDPQKQMPPDINEAEVVYILGNGLRDYDLWQMDSIPAIHFPGSTPQGVVKVRFPESIKVGEELNINGLYGKPKSGHRLVLQGPAGTGLDSLELNKGVKQGFQLKTQLKAAGNFVYYLAEKDSEGKIITQDPLPVQVEEKKSLKILVLNNFPTFETKYLKNFLAEAGHELVVRSQITRGRFKFEYFNTSRSVISDLSRETLEPYDLLIIDAASLRNLGGSQTRAIQNAVRDDGLGVFIQPDESFFNSPGTLGTLKFERQRRNETELEEWPEIKLSTFPYAFGTSTAQEMIRAAGGDNVAGYNNTGQGRVGTTVLSNTWQLVLEGNSSDYRQIWSQMIGRISKREEVTAQLKQKEQFVFQNEPFPFIIRSEMADPVITNEKGRILPLVQDVNFSEQWKSIQWPREKGWHGLHHDTTTVFNFYVAEEGSWDALTAQNTLQNNKVYFDEAISSRERQKPVQPVNPLWFYGIFLFCMGGLWLEPKLSQR